MTQARHKTALDPRQILAAITLAHCGYRPGERTRSGAVAAAARAAGVHRDTVLRWSKLGEFIDEVHHQRGKLISNLVGALKTAATAGNPAAAIFLLQSLEPSVFDPRMRLERLRHKHTKAVMRLKAKLTDGLDDDDVEYRVVYEESGETPPPDERRH